MTVPLEVDPAALDAAGSVLALLAGRVDAVGRQLETATMSPPNVGDLPATAAFSQAHYDWTQTRFEDLVASAQGFDHLAQTVHAVGVRYANGDTGGANGLVTAATTGADRA